CVFGAMPLRTYLRSGFAPICPPPSRRLTIRRHQRFLVKSSLVACHQVQPPSYEVSMLLEAERPSIVLVDHDSAGVGRLLRIHGFPVRKYSSPQALLTDLESVSPACIIA